MMRPAADLQKHHYCRGKTMFHDDNTQFWQALLASASRFKTAQSRQTVTRSDYRPHFWEETAARRYNPRSPEDIE